MNIFNHFIDLNYQKGMGITDITDEFFCVYLNQLLQKDKKNILVVVNSLYEANQLYNSLQNYTDCSFLFPMDDFLTSEAIAISPDLKINRLETLNSVIQGKNSIVITNLMGYLRFLPTKEHYRNACIDLKVGMEIDPKELIKNLIYLGYIKESFVTKTGEVGVRGFVIDVYPIGEENPIRIEFFGDVIESIRFFSSSTQKSINSVSNITIYPFTEFITDKEIDLDILQKQKYLPKYTSRVSNISDYLDNVIVCYKDYSQIEVSYSQIMEEVFTYQTSKDNDFTSSYMFHLEDLNPSEYFYYMGLNNTSSKIESRQIISLNVHTISNFNENLKEIREFIKEKIHCHKKVIICMNKKRGEKVLKKIGCKYQEVTDKVFFDVVNLVDFPMSQGFIYLDYVFLTENELFIHQSSTNKYKTRFKYGSKIKDINSLQIGDYVVHHSHGIGIYNGIKVLTTNNISRDYLEVLYYGTDKLYIPVEKIDLLSKYVGQEGTVPKINKMNGVDWKKTKSKIRNRVADIADKLLNLYAERESRKGFSYSKDSLFQKQFEDECEFQLTIDQELAVNQIKEDMESIHPMDRLLCGDVGFGKTEVAFRAIFKAILDSKQVLFLCPTTILSSQHYDNAKKRFQNFPVNIAILNRFTSPGKVRQIKEGLLEGTVDLVIGTHRLLSKDILVKDLGLLIIDEEQRFGVLHKEKIKQYKTNIDVLTLTATPIPRTLQMSMMGVRSLSLIETPPVDRYPIQTYVVEENQSLIKDAIYKELSRDGQVFVLYNRVENIDSKVSEIKRIVPDARVDFAHGQMGKKELENKMYSFIAHEFDVLVCTTIIETGIDIPNANTLIILNADRFGLSQLYQIRGRVGRSNRFAYAYLMYHPAKVLTEQAIKRLNVIKEFTELGSGFSIATRDLSIRGAGDILGSEQAGFIDTVGIDLYMKMLEQEIAKRKGLKVEEEDQTDTNQPVLSVATHIDDQYVTDEKLKIEIHRKINEIDSKEKLLQIKEELEDRFGKINEDILIYMYEEWFEKQVNSVKIKTVNQTKNYIELVFSKDVVEQLDTEALFMEAFNITNMFRFKSKGSNLVIILDTIHLEEHPLFYLTRLLDYIEHKFLNCID